MTAENEGNDNAEDQKTKKRKERLEQNRISARESRRRKKTMIEELQRTVITLSRENKELNDTNAALRKQLLDLAAKYPNVISMQSIMPAQPAPVAGSDAAAAATTAAEATAAMAGSQQQPAAPVAPNTQAAAFPAGMFFFPQATGQWDPAQFQQQMVAQQQAQVAQQQAQVAQQAQQVVAQQQVPQQQQQEAIKTEASQKQ